MITALKLVIKCEKQILIGDKIPIDGILLTDVAYIDEKTISGTLFKKSNAGILRLGINKLLVLAPLVLSFDDDHEA